jgi:hypothetical protein
MKSLLKSLPGILKRIVLHFLFPAKQALPNNARELLAPQAGAPDAQFIETDENDLRGTRIPEHLHHTLPDNYFQEKRRRLVRGRGGDVCGWGEDYLV